MEAEHVSEAPSTLAEVPDHAHLEQEQMIEHSSKHSSKHSSNADDEAPALSSVDEMAPKLDNIDDLQAAIKRNSKINHDIPSNQRVSELKSVHQIVTKSVPAEDEHVSPQEAFDHEVHTDSMVTIRLSGDQVQPLADEELPSLQRTSTDSISSRVHFDDEILSREPQEELEDANNPILAEADEDLYTSRRASVDSSFQHTVQDMGTELERCAVRERRNSIGSFSSGSGESAHVDWDKLDRNELQEQRDEGTDESTAFLLARLEQENHALATDPKASLAKPENRIRSRSRPPSMQQLRKLVSEPMKASLRYSLLPSPPPMTELEFWSALVSNYPQTAQRLPTLTSNKIRGGIPPPLRGVVWMSIAGARERFLEDEYDRLCGESSPYEKLIGKDIGRSYPGVDMFRDPDGDGQKMLGRVLNAFSLWDQEIGYCQGLGFVVGPLLMHMGDKDAFCVLVRLMEHYDLRSCFLPNLSGLHLRIYQFQKLLSQHLPQLSAHLEKLKLEPLYLSQWFLSFFGVTCPLPMLLRIYDVILTEGASETLMRVALSLMRRNEKKILAATEFEDIMQLLLSRMLWDTYKCNADDLVNDFCGLTGLVTRERLQALETSFKESQNGGLLSPTFSRPSVHSAASRFLGKFWAGSSQSPKGNAASPSLQAPPRPVSNLRRTPSKQSMASTLNSMEGSESSTSTASTDGTNMSRQTSADWIPVKQTLSSTGAVSIVRVAPNKDKDLHSQIEDLLTALSDIQRDQIVLTSELQREREERDEDRAVVQRAIDRIKKRSMLVAIPEDGQGDAESEPSSSEDLDGISELEEHFAATINRRSSVILQTKQQLREDVSRWKDQHSEESARSAELSRKLTETERESSQLKEQLREARSRVQEVHKDKQRLEKTVQDLRLRISTTQDYTPDSPTITGSEIVTSPNGLREFKLGRMNSTSQPTAAYSKRMSSLSAQAILATEDHRPAPDDTLLLELVNAKTAEAVARQELEEVKGKLDSLRKLLGGGPMPLHRGSGPNPGSTAPMAFAAAVALKNQEPVKVGMPNSPATPNSAGGFFSGWGRRTASTAGVAGS